MMLKDNKEELHEADQERGYWSTTACYEVSKYQAVNVMAHRLEVFDEG